MSNILVVLIRSQVYSVLSDGVVDMHEVKITDRNTERCAKMKKETETFKFRSIIDLATAINPLIIWSYVKSNVR